MNACTQWVMEQITQDGFTFMYVPNQKRYISVISSSSKKELNVGGMVIDPKRVGCSGIVIGIDLPTEENSSKIITVWFAGDLFPTRVKFEDLKW